MTEVDAGYTDEFGFVTELMTESAYEEGAGIVEVINKIRLDV